MIMIMKKYLSILLISIGIQILLTSIVAGAISENIDGKIKFYNPTKLDQALCQAKYSKSCEQAFEDKDIKTIQEIKDATPPLGSSLKDGKFVMPSTDPLALPDIPHVTEPTELKFSILTLNIDIIHFVMFVSILNARNKCQAMLAVDWSALSVISGGL